jgi:hypothetical protein
VRPEELEPKQHEKNEEQEDGADPEVWLLRYRTSYGLDCDKDITHTRETVVTRVFILQY